MRIGELAERSGLTRSKIRFYEARGLIPKAKRQPNGYREYPPQTVQIVEIIPVAQSAGFSLKDIRHLLPTAGLGRWNKEALLATLTHKLEEIEVLQQRLRQDKAKLLEVIRRTQNKLPEVTCAQNAEQLLKRLTPIVRQRAAGSRA